MNYEELYRKATGKEYLGGEKVDMVEAINTLPPQIRDVMLYRYKEELTLQRIANMFGLSRQRISDIEQEGLRLLAPKIEKRGNDIRLLGLSKAAYQTLERAGIYTIAEVRRIAKLNKLTTIKGLGVVKAENIMKCLIEYDERTVQHGNTI